MPTIFSRIVAGEIPCYKVAESDKFFAFLDISPVAKGHTLVIPKAETDYLFDINDSDLQEMILFAKRVAASLKKTVPCQRIGLTVMGLEVPHAHIHLIPMSSEGDMNFAKTKLSLPAEEMQEIAASIAVGME